MNEIEQIRDVLANGDKWLKGKMDDLEGRHCLMGAVVTVDYQFGLTVATDGLFTFEATRLIDQVIREQYPDRLHWKDWHGVPGFNDHEDTDWADIETVLDKASVLWEERLR
jgi:hypothetical protein